MVVRQDESEVLSEIAVSYLRNDYTSVMATELFTGLCKHCRWATVVTSGKGSVFLRCGLSDSDKRFARYPVLPVGRCDGFEGS